MRSGRCAGEHEIGGQHRGTRVARRPVRILRVSPRIRCFAAGSRTVLCTCSEVRCTTRSRVNEPIGAQVSVSASASRSATFCTIAKNWDVGGHRVTRTSSSRPLVGGHLGHTAVDQRTGDPGVDVLQSESATGDGQPTLTRFGTEGRFCGRRSATIGRAIREDNQIGIRKCLRGVLRTSLSRNCANALRSCNRVSAGSMTAST